MGMIETAGKWIVFEPNEAEGPFKALALAVLSSPRSLVGDGLYHSPHERFGPMRAKHLPIARPREQT